MFSETNKQQQMTNNESKQQKQQQGDTLIHWSDEAKTLWDKRE